jgi:hypothetical protein
VDHLARLEHKIFAAYHHANDQVTIVEKGAVRMVWIFMALFDQAGRLCEN